VKNGNETDIDCGSSKAGTDTSAPACDAASNCLANVDCKSGGCNVAKKCAWARSCTPLHGGTTCGTGDAAGANTNEDCCASADVPTYNEDGYTNTTAFRLDKYQITSGRIRRFLDAVSGNVKGWVVANRANVMEPNQLPIALDAYLPTGWTQPDSADNCDPDGNGAGGPFTKCNYGALAHVSGYRYNNGPGGDNGYGCYMGNVNAGGTRTFYMTDTERALLGNGEEQHLVSREREEEKAMTCATYFILAAFCAWDGGRLETYAEYNAAYGGNGTIGRTYPWGSDAATRALGYASVGSHIASPNVNWGFTPPADPVNGTYSVYNPGLDATQKANLALRLQRANLSWNYAGSVLFDYLAPLENRARVGLPESLLDVTNDKTPAVAPPGRFPMGEGRYGHRDLLGNVLEITAQPGTATTGNHQWGRNGSFETSHFIASNMTGAIGYNFVPLTKYGRAGGRCVRPAGAYPITALPEAP
jgi:hypothetical protein